MRGGRKLWEVHDDSLGLRTGQLAWNDTKSIHGLLTSHSQRLGNIKNKGYLRSKSRTKWLCGPGKILPAWLWLAAEILTGVKPPLGPCFARQLFLKAGACPVSSWHRLWVHLNSLKKCFKKPLYYFYVLLQMPIVEGSRTLRADQCKRNAMEGNDIQGCGRGSPS